MKIPYTFVLLSSCVMISSAMAMNDPNKVGVEATTSTRTPQASVPLFDEAVRSLELPVVVVDESAAAKSASSSASTSPASSTSSSFLPACYAQLASFPKPTEELPSDGFLAWTGLARVADLAAQKSNSDGQVQPDHILVESSENGLIFMKYSKRPSQVFDVSSEQKFIKCYWAKLRQLVGDFVEQNQKDKKSFFAPAMVSLRSVLKLIDEDVKMVIDSGPRVFDLMDNLERIVHILTPLLSFLTEADYYVWKVKMSEEGTIYPWDAEYSTLGLDEEDRDEGKKNVLNQLGKMTSSDRRLHSELPFLQYLSAIMEQLEHNASLLFSISASSSIYGENKWDRPSAEHKQKSKKGVRVANTLCIQQAIALAEEGNTQFLDSVIQKVNVDIFQKMSSDSEEDDKEDNDNDEKNNSSDNE